MGFPRNREGFLMLRRVGLQRVSRIGPVTSTPPNCAGADSPRRVGSTPRVGTRGLTASNPKAPDQQRFSSLEESGRQLHTDATSLIHLMKTEELVMDNR
jgi:hypothetical protein